MKKNLSTLIFFTAFFILAPTPTMAEKLSTEQLCQNIAFILDLQKIDIIEIRKKAIETADMYQKCLIVSKGQILVNTCEKIKKLSWELMGSYVFEESSYYNNLGEHNDCSRKLRAQKRNGLLQGIPDDND